MFDIRARGDWNEGQVTARSVAGGRVILPPVERAIEAAWLLASSRPGIHLFDGPMCRLETWSASAQNLELSLSRTSYKPFLGTNLHNAHLADRFGVEILANPVGLSTILQTSDRWLLLGRRNEAVAYYPGRVHPFAGALEPDDEVNVFAEVRRELREELAMSERDIAQMRCIGLVEDRRLRQPELIFLTATTLTRDQVEANLDRTEHRSAFAVAAEGKAVRGVLSDPALTPVAAAALTLWAESHDLPPHLPPT